MGFPVEERFSFADIPGRVEEWLAGLETPWPELLEEAMGTGEPQEKVVEEGWISILS